MNIFENIKVIICALMISLVTMFVTGCGDDENSWKKQKMEHAKSNQYRPEYNNTDEANGKYVVDIYKHTVHVKKCVDVGKINKANKVFYPSREAALYHYPKKDNLCKKCMN